ncbi:uncharacterized protein LOC109842234 [Asparagus officinalis]|uniref:uncharacterized protein LOC109842234 n=1 Tax=Asparagus officinalis TaxID=4686 RepID=UPI00098E8409|nr:uncharacterized protein LOC109842234 [Asparagus officinalis]
MSGKGMKTLFLFYSKNDIIGASSEAPSTEPTVDDKEEEQHSPKIQKVNDTVSYDPGLRQAIWKYPYKEQDEVQHRYIAIGPCQPNLQEYPRNEDGRSFRYDWFKTYDWLEYSETTDRAYCFPCFLFESNSSQQHKQEAWTSKGFIVGRELEKKIVIFECMKEKHDQYIQKMI